MKAKYILSGLLMVALVIGGTGYGVAADSGGKVTGGGTFINTAGGSNDYASPGNKISFGFNGQRLDNGAKGQFQLVNHDKRMRLHGTFDTYDVIPQGSRVVVVLGGECSIDGANGSFRAEITARTSFEIIEIWIGDSPSSLPHIKGQIYKGNITKHEKNKK